MRLWHQSLIQYLPKNQLLGQHRECCALRGAGWGRKHATVDYVFIHPPQWLFAYHEVVMLEMHKRGYKVSKEWSNPYYRGKNESWWSADSFIGHEPEKHGTYRIYPEHNEAYLLECLANLSAKGINIDISEIKGVEQHEIFKLAYRLIQEAHAENRERTAELRRLLSKHRKPRKSNNTVRDRKRSQKSLTVILKPIKPTPVSVESVPRHSEQSPTYDGAAVEEKTIIETVIYERPDLDENYVVMKRCPSKFGFLNGVDCESPGYLCTDCWNRPAEGNRMEEQP